MPYFYTHYYKYLSVFIVITLLYNSIVPAFASIYTVSKAQQAKISDAILMCTGDRFQWVSASAYINRGAIIAVELPIDAPQKTAHIDCSFNYLSDKNSDKSILVPTIVDASTAYDTRMLLLAQHKYTAFTYLKTLTRAPPSI